MPPLDREFIVKIVSQRKDSFVVLPKLFVDELRPLATSPSLDWQFVPVRMNVTNKAENNKKMTTTSTSSPTTPPTPTTPQTNTTMFVGALVTKNASSERVVEIGPTLAIDLGLGEGDIVAVSAAGTNWKIARKLEITPVNVNESEVVEKNALELQNNLMQSLRVLSLGQKITLRTPAGVCAMVEVLRGSTITSPTNAGCYVLTQGTELHIAVKTRESTKKEVVQPPLPGKLKLLSFSQLSEISNLATTPQDLVSQLVKSHPIAGLMSGADPSILVSPHAASTLNWHDGLLIGYYNIAALLWCNNGSESDSAPTTSNNQKQSRTATSATKFGACTPEFLREHSVLGRVRVIQSSHKEDEAVVAVDNAHTIAQVDALVGSNIWCIVPSLLSASNPHANATIVAVPNPPVQLYGRKVGCGEGTNRNGSFEARSTLTTVLLSPSPSSGGGTSSGGSILTLPRTMGALPYIAVEDVHGKAVLGELRDALSTCSSLPTTLFNRNVILVGPRGSGKSTLVGRAALSSGRHVVYVDCNAVPTSLSTTVNAAIAQAAACSPSVIVLDGLDAIASTASGSARQGPTQLSTSTTQMVYSWLVETARCYGDISIVATAHSYDELVPICKLPQCFPTVLKMPASLLSEGKFQLVKQLVTAAVTGKAHPNMMTPSEPTVVLHGVVVRHVDGLSRHIATLLTPSLDNYSPSDIVAVTNRVLRKCIPTTLSTALAPITLSNADDNDDESNKKVSVIMQEHIPQEAVDDVVAAFVPQSRAGISFLQTGGGEGSRKASWDDAGGLKEAKAALHDVLVLPSKYPHIFKNLPLKSKSGIMLHGPSGCGKTFLLTVVAAAENLHCIVVNGPEIFGKYIGTSEQKIREIFENAQAAAPCVVFFDEFDSVAPRRGNSNTGVTDRVVNQLLCYLDGVESRSDVYVVAATSRPDLIDPALLRPGRLDRHVECPMPSHSDRMEIFAAHLRTASEGKDTLPPEDLDTLASATESWTSADIAGLVSSAHTHMLQRFLNVTVGSLLGEDNDDRAADPTQDDAFMLVDSHVSSNDQNGVVDAALKKSRQKTIESLRRVAEGGGAGADSKVVASGGVGSSDTNADREVLLPTLQVTDLQEAMLTFNRSRQVEEPRSTAGKRSGQKKNLTQAQLAQIQQMVGTRQTSQ